jgi:hypothetical protein
MTRGTLAPSFSSFHKRRCAEGTPLLIQNTSLSERLLKDRFFYSDEDQPNVRRVGGLCDAVVAGRLDTTN